MSNLTAMIFQTLQTTLQRLNHSSSNSTMTVADGNSIATAAAYHSPSAADDEGWYYLYRNVTWLLINLLVPVLLYRAANYLWYVHCVEKRDHGTKLPLPPGDMGLPLVGNMINFLIYVSFFKFYSWQIVDNLTGIELGIVEKGQVLRGIKE